ncbi:CbtA family protein [Methylococcus capsulatus]|uniref:CbtA family protein n=1 Tax=Methylococcus capsulatus TaxID=414 RepID=UPI0020177C8E|nr:CbtA family protein [Methylococcus capsulatus]UQN12102.1 CbtA family protein [Methylococcus capsulatus]
MPLTGMFRALAFSAVLAGLSAASVLTLAQAFWVTPLILDAEVYEEAAAAGMPEPAETPDGAFDAWRPETGWPRLLATAAGNCLLGIGYGLMMTALYAWRRPKGMTQGLAWGLAGFVVFFAAPGLGLPPELPGDFAAELGARQSWWLATALCTTGGLALLGLQERRVLRLLGVLLLALPHLVGAPHPPVSGGLAPETLRGQFRLATLLSNALFWGMLGGVSAVAFRRFCPAE